MRRLPRATTFNAADEVENLRYQIVRADALAHAADELFEEVGTDRLRREHLGHLVTLSAEATTLAVTMASALARQIRESRSDG